MKNSLLLLCSILIVNLVSADEFEKKYGNGVVHIQFDSLYLVEFFSAPGAPTPSHHVSILRNAWNIGTHYVNFDSIHFADTVPGWFTPLYYITRGEYARIDIVAIDSAGGYYRTILKDDQGRDVWVKKQKHITFLTWLGFYNTVASIELNDGDLILYDKPDPKSKRVNYTPMMGTDDRATMRALELNGHWMKVEIQIPQRDPMMSWKTYTGWIKWRDEKQPLIKYNLMGC